MKDIDKNGYWKISSAEKVSVLLDADEYFRSLYMNLCRAQRRITFLGWDFDSRLDLMRSTPKSSLETPTTLAALLAHLAKETPDLEIFILAWDFSTIYLPMREMFQKLKFRGMHTKVKFVFDGQHPLGSSHHQKIVVIDDTIAYSGGLDITSHRWDTSDHKAKNSLRQDSGKSFAPFHDAMTAVTGPVAKDLAALSRERIYRAEGTRLAPVENLPNNERFYLEPAFENVSVGISRTNPCFRDYAEIREVEAAYIDQIQTAEHYIYIENQYLNSPEIVDLLTKSLSKERGPAILIVLPQRQSDAMSKLFMGVLTEVAIITLQKADNYNRLIVTYPCNPELSSDQYENVHSKVMAVDDRLLRIGSANLNDRSMGLDTECDLTFFASTPDDREKFRRTTARMISNHFPYDQERVLMEWNDAGGDFRSLVDALSHDRHRHLAEFDLAMPPSALPKIAVYGTFRRTTKFERIADAIMFRGFNDEISVFFRTVPVGLISTVVSCFIIAYANLYFDFSETLFPFSYLPDVKIWNAYFAATLVAAYALGGLMIVPVPLLIAWTIAVLGWHSLPVIIGGIAVTALSGYTAGRLIGKHPKRMPGRWLPLVDEKLKSAKFWGIFWCRFFPFAPFALSGFFCGRNQLVLWRYLSASFLGFLPYLISIFFLHLQLLRFFEKPSFLNIATLAAVAAPIFYSIRFVQKRFALGVSHSTNQITRS